ncbi:MAG: amidohydrolase family protein [Candidatus Bathyarchaeia archaeon]
MRIKEEVFDKLRKEFFIIDVHEHIGETLGLGGRKITPEEVIKKMDLNGIEKAVISPIVGHSLLNGYKDVMAQNDYIVKALEKYPDRFPCGLGIVNPYIGDKAVEEAHRIMGDLGLRGVMLHPLYQGHAIDEPLFLKVYEALSKYRKAVVLVHTDGSLEEPWRLWRPLEMFPNVTFISGHPMSTGFLHFGQHIPLCKMFKNLYIDTALWFKDENMLPAVKAIGAKRIVFGADLGGMSTISYDLIQLLLTETFSDEEKELIFSKNAAEIFDIKV